MVFTTRLRGVLADDLRTTRLGINVRGPIDHLVELFSDQQLAGQTIKGVAKSITIEVGQKLRVVFAILILHGDIDQRHFVDTVIIPFVMWGHLINPLGRTGIRIASPDGHRPLVIARTLHRVPRRRIA